MKPLKEFVTDIRLFLEPIWIKAHEAWADEPIPSPPSKYMCRYSCLFLKHALHEAGYGDWKIYLGRPVSRELQGTEQGLFGYRSVDGGWHDHAWLIKDGMLIDITADQYGDLPVIVDRLPFDKYNANLTEKEVAADLQKLSGRVSMWLAEWQKREIPAVN